MNTSQKGKALEKKVAEELLKNNCGTFAIADDSGRGLDKREIKTDAKLNGMNLNIECKNQKTLAIKKWWKQTQDACETTGTAPALAFHIHGTSETLVAISLVDFCKLISLEKTGFKLSYDDKQKLEAIKKENKRVADFKQKQRDVWAKQRKNFKELDRKDS